MLREWRFLVPLLVSAGAFTAPMLIIDARGTGWLPEAIPVLLFLLLPMLSISSIMMVGLSGCMSLWLAWRRKPEQAHHLAMAGAALGFLLLMWAAGSGARGWRLNNLQQITGRMTSVVAAIRFYEDQHRAAPAQLSDVGIQDPVPSGWSGCGPMRYKHLTNSEAFHRWELGAQCVRGFATWDHLWYWPDRTYEMTSNLTPIGEWAYLWD